jgi:hypothetical protein
MFRFFEAPAWLVCTEPVRDRILDAGWTNVAFDEVGEVLD